MIHMMQKLPSGFNSAKDNSAKDASALSVIINNI